MKLKAEVIFGGLSVIIGGAVLYYARKQAANPTQINVLPPLQTGTSYAPGQPTANNASIPAFYASPFQVTPDLLAASTGKPTQVPYQVYNMPPSHVESKQAVQQAQVSDAQNATDAARQSCNGMCVDCQSHKQCKTYAPRTTMTAVQKSTQVNNALNVGNRPVATPQRKVSSIYSPATAFNLATQRTVPAALSMSNQGITLIGNVPSVTDLIQ